ncbi:MAG: putative signal peptide protein [Polaromonas sp.]|nr:putative signal peptide protein [Polaromonas sp.]
MSYWQTPKMQKTSNLNLKQKWLLTLGAAAIFGVVNLGNALAQGASSRSGVASADALLEKYAALKPQLMQNAYHRPLVFESAENADTVTSAVYAVLDSPFNVVSATFKKPDRWCEVLILHLNTKYCQASAEPVKPARLAVNIGKKTPQHLADTFLLEFSHRVTSEASNYLAVELHANKGPLNTTDYQLQLLAAPLPDGRTFITLRYSYGYGMAGKLAMQTYLSTVGRGKVGFSKLASNEKSAYVGGMRGAVERNTMRYYLAMEAYLASLKQSSPQQIGARLQYWFDATEEYPLQLREVDRSSYMAMKKDEYQRQQTTPLAQ